MITCFLHDGEHRPRRRRQPAIGGVLAAQTLGPCRPPDSMDSRVLRQRLLERHAGASMAAMPMEVYTATRPAIPLRAWVSSILLLISASGLAGWISWGRSGELLAPRLEPQGWDMSFRPPRRFEPVMPDILTAANAIAYRTPTASGGVAELVFRRVGAAPNVDAGEICNHLLRPYASVLMAVFSPPPTRSTEKLGALDAVQVHFPGIPMIVRAARFDHGTAYAVSLRVDGGPIDESLYHSFDLACRSVDFKRGSGVGR